MKADISRDTFAPTKNYSRVVMQQGRVQLDNDWNEQASVLLQAVREIGRDLAGPHGTVADNVQDARDFEIFSDVGTATRPTENLRIRQGRYYVDGLCCLNRKDRPFEKQPGYPFPDSDEITRADSEAANAYFLYLDVWERDVSPLEDPNLYEPALGGADTTTRSELLWQVKAKAVINTEANTPDSLLKELRRVGRLPHLEARAQRDEENNDPCNVEPQSRYRGPENQLYRVEVHTGGDASTATFKWSRDNGSAAFAIEKLSGAQVTLAPWGNDTRWNIRPGGVVEIVDQEHRWRGVGGPLLVVDQVDDQRRTVTLIVPDGMSLPVYDENSELKPVLRPWDHRPEVPFDEDAPHSIRFNAVPVTEYNAQQTPPKDAWVDLDDGIFVRFHGAAEATPEYRPGDYWLIAARTGIGDILWPPNGEGSPVQPPRGIQHAYAPLAGAAVSASGDVEFSDLRRIILRRLHVVTS